MKITLMSQAATLAASCIYTKYKHGCEITSEDIETAENVMIKLFVATNNVNAGLIRTVLGLKRAIHLGESYLNALEDVVQEIAKHDLPLSALKDEECKIRNQLQILVCSADEAIGRLEDEEAHAIYETAS